MNSRNLIPLARRHAALAAARKRFWSIACPAAGVAALVVWAACYSGSTLHSAAANELHDSRKAIAELKTKATLLGVQNAKVQRVLQSATQVATQPDWSVLLALIAGNMPKDLALTRCELVDHQLSGGGITNSGAPAGNKDCAVDLHLSGVAQSQSTIASYVLSLQALRLFDDVHLLHSSPQAANAMPVIGFELDCPIGLKPGAQGTEVK